MNIKTLIQKKWTLVAAAAILSIILLAISTSVVLAYPPTSGTASMVVYGAPGTLGTYVDVSLNGGSRLPGWCTDRQVYVTPGQTYQVTIYDYFGNYYPGNTSALPSWVRAHGSWPVDWNSIAYVLNNKQGTWSDIQDAIWYFGDDGSKPSSGSTARAMVDAAITYNNTYGPFVPSVSQLKPIICYLSNVQTVVYELRVSGTTTLLSNNTITLGGSVTDNATVSPSSVTGTVDFQWTTDNITWTKFGATKNLVGGNATSDAYTPASVGTYYFRAIYNGDGNYTVSQSGDTEEPLTVTSLHPAGACFIATAAYGSYLDPHIQILRDFRDQYLLTNPAGEALVEFYYKVSPPMAEFINEHPALKPVVRAGLVPAVAMSRVAVNTTLAQKMAIVGSVAIVSGTLALWLTRRSRRLRRRR